MSHQEIRFPMLHAHDLNGKKWIVPHDLPAKKTLLLVAFERRQQDSVDSWIHGLGLQSPNNRISWIEMPFLQRRWKLVGSWIDQGMRHGITEEKLRARVWTVYANRAAFLKTMDLTSTKFIAVLVVNKDGIVLAKRSGDYSENASQIILNALES